MKKALFTNFTTEEFKGCWDGKCQTFAPGEQKYMPDYLAHVFAKHLANRELLRKDKSGNLIYPGGDRMTSPKKPEEVPMFVELFNKAFQVVDDTPEQKKNELDVILEIMNPVKPTQNLKFEGSDAPSTVLASPDDTFEGKPNE